MPTQGREDNLTSTRSFTSSGLVIRIKYRVANAGAKIAHTNAKALNVRTYLSANIGATATTIAPL